MKELVLKFEFQDLVLEQGYGRDEAIREILLAHPQITGKYVDIVKTMLKEMPLNY